MIPGIQHQEVRQQGGAAVSGDVRRLIAQAEKGNPFDFESEGLAYDMGEALERALAERLGSHSPLAVEMARRLDAFSRRNGATYAYVRLVITDALPDLREYNPCELTVFDGTQEQGSDFSNIVQRATIHGTQMTSMNVTELREYFERGRKRQLLVMLGSDRQHDIQKLDTLVKNLAGIADMGGISREAVQEIITAIRSGKATPAIVKMATALVQLATLQALPISAGNLVMMTQLSRDIGRLVVVIRANPSVSPALSKGVRAVAAVIRVGVRVVLRHPVAQNDNKALLSSPLSTQIRETLRAARLDVPQRREAAARFARKKLSAQRASRQRALFERHARV